MVIAAPPIEIVHGRVVVAEAPERVDDRAEIVGRAPRQRIAVGRGVLAQPISDEASVTAPLIAPSPPATSIVTGRRSPSSRRGAAFVGAEQAEKIEGARGLGRRAQALGRDGGDQRHTRAIRSFREPRFLNANAFSPIDYGQPGPIGHTWTRPRRPSKPPTMLRRRQMRRMGDVARGGAPVDKSICNSLLKCESCADVARTLHIRRFRLTSTGRSTAGFEQRAEFADV